MGQAIYYVDSSRNSNMSACKIYGFTSIEEFNNRLLSLDDFAKVLREYAIHDGGNISGYIPHLVETMYGELKFTLDEWLDLINGVNLIDPHERTEMNLVLIEEK